MFFPYGYDGFDPRSRMGSDVINADSFGHRIVSIHAPAWEATCLEGYRAANGGVSIHAPAWEATPAACRATSIALFRSTLPHGKRPEMVRHLVVRKQVSIHAPAWGATLIGLVAHQHHAVSIHAPAWGATSVRRECLR